MPTAFSRSAGLPSAVFSGRTNTAALSAGRSRTRLIFSCPTKDCGRSRPTRRSTWFRRRLFAAAISRADRSIYNPLSLDANGNRAPFPNNTIPASMIDPAVAKYLALYEPLPNAPLANGFDYVDSTPNRDDSDNGSVRMDRAWGERSRLFARYTINDERSVLAGSFPALPTAENLRAQQVAIGNTFAGASWVNETRFSFTRLRVFDLSTNAFGTNVLANLGITGLANDPVELRTARR